MAEASRGVRTMREAGDPGNPGDPGRPGERPEKFLLRLSPRWWGRGLPDPVTRKRKIYVITRDASALATRKRERSQCISRGELSQSVSQSVRQTGRAWERSWGAVNQNLSVLPGALFFHRVDYGDRQTKVYGWRGLPRAVATGCKISSEREGRK